MVNEDDNERVLKNTAEFLASKCADTPKFIEKMIQRLKETGKWH